MRVADFAGTHCLKRHHYDVICFKRFFLLYKILQLAYKFVKINISFS